MYGPKGTGCSRLKKVDAEVRRLKALPEAEYGSEALATARRWGRPVGIIHYLAGRKPEWAAGTYRTRRMRARKSGHRMPMGETWEHHAQGGKCFGWNGKVLTARLQIGGRVWPWPLKVVDEEKAEALMAPVRVARERLRQAAAEELDCELGTIAALDAAAARAGARAQLARAIIRAGGPEKLADFVRKGPQEEVGTAVLQQAAVFTAAPSATLSATAEKQCKQLCAIAPRRRAKSKPALERARGAIEELYPEGVPEQAVEPNAYLCRRVGEKLRQAGLHGVSDDTILRAAGRRK